MVMKYFYGVVFLFLVCGSTAFAKNPTDADSLYVDSIAAVTPFPAKILGKRDNQFETINQSLPLVDVFFRKNVGGLSSKVINPIKVGSTVFIYGKKDLSVDTSAGRVVFASYTDADGYRESSEFILGDGENIITVPDHDWQYIEFTLPGVGTPVVAKSYMIDAVMLIQDTDAPPVSVPSTRTLSAFGLRTNYPNPFEGTTNVSYSLEQSSDVQIAIVDLSGVEHARIDLGYQDAGQHSEPLNFTDRGIYFIRLFVNGIPLGSPLKVVSQ